MQNYSARLRAALWWLLPLAALAALIGWQTDWGRAVEMRRPPPVAIAPAPVVVSLLPEYTIDSGTGGRTEMVERTLFNPTRRPAPALPQEGGQPRMVRGQFALTGTTVSEGKSTAFLRESSGKSRRVQAGDSINGLKVAEVKADRVMLTLGDESEELMLKIVSNPRPAVPPPTAAAAMGSMPQPAPGVAQVPTAQPAQPGAQGVEQSLAERRRAARAAQPVVDGQPPPPGGVITAPVQPTPVAPAAQPANADARWQEVYRRYQQQQR